MGGCKLVVGDVDVLLAEGKRQHGDAIEEESLLEMLCSTVREEMKVVQSVAGAATDDTSHALLRGSRDCSQHKPQSGSFVISQPALGFSPIQT